MVGVSAHINNGCTYTAQMHKRSLTFVVQLRLVLFTLTMNQNMNKCFTWSRSRWYIRRRFRHEYAHVNGRRGQGIISYGWRV